MNYLFYGTLRDPEVMELVAGRQILDKRAENVDLSGYGCYFVRGENFPALRVVPTAVTPATLYRNLTAREIHALAAFEGEEYRTQKLSTAHLQNCHYFNYIETSLISSQPWIFEDFLEKHKAKFLVQVQQWIHSGNWPAI